MNLGMFFNYKKYRTYAGFFISLILIFLILKIIDFDVFLKNLAKLDFRILFLLLLFYPFGMTIRTFRWRCLINQNKKVSFSSTLFALALGFMVNQIFPAKIGEVVRAENIAKEKSISRSFLLGTVFAERILDTLLLLVFLSLSVLFSKTSINITTQNNMLFLIALFAVIAISMILFLNKKLQEFITCIIPFKFRSRAKIIIEKIAESFNFLKKKKLFLRIVLFTFLIWLGIFVKCVILLFALKVTLPFYAYFFIVTVGALGMAIPSSSGNIGIYHAASMGAVMLFMVDKETAFTYAVISHAYNLIPNVIFGLFVSIKKNISLVYFRKIAKNDKSFKEIEPAP